MKGQLAKEFKRVLEKKKEVQFGILLGPTGLASVHFIEARLSLKWHTMHHTHTRL